MVESEVQWIELLSTDRASLEKLAAELGIHPLAVEDCVNHNQRAKFEDFEKHQFLVWFAFIHGEVYELEFVVFPKTILLVTNAPAPNGSSWHAFLQLGSHHRDSAHLLYQALDRTLDLSAKNVLPLFGAIDEFEENMLHHKQGDLHNLLKLKRQLARAEYALSYLAAVVGQLQQFLNPRDDLRWRLRDLWDHCQRVYQALVFHRVQIANTMDMYWGVTARRTNDQIKKLTLLASVSVPLTFWTSFWGMNFAVIPFDKPWLFLVALGTMALSILGVFVFLKSRGFWEEH
ncbi:MAG: CorA family divalent cation transporter [Bdellovibrionota bacterium]